MGLFITIHCKKCGKKESVSFGHGFMSCSVDGAKITEDNKNLVQEFVPEADRATFAKIARRKNLVADLHHGKEIYGCNDCGTFASETRLVVKDENHNVVYDAMSPKCQKCYKPMDLVKCSIEKSAEFPYLTHVKCELKYCPVCGGEIEIDLGGNLD